MRGDHITRVPGNGCCASLGTERRRHGWGKGFLPRHQICWHFNLRLPRPTAVIHKCCLQAVGFVICCYSSQKELRRMDICSILFITPVTGRKPSLTQPNTRDTEVARANPKACALSMGSAELCGFHIKQQHVMIFTLAWYCFLTVWIASEWAYFSYFTIFLIYALKKKADICGYLYLVIVWLKYFMISLSFLNINRH